MTIYGFYEDIPYLNSIIIMEFLSAGSLDDYVQKNHLPKNVLLKFAADIARVLNSDISKHTLELNLAFCSLTGYGVFGGEKNNTLRFGCPKCARGGCK